MNGSQPAEGQKPPVTASPSSTTDSNSGLMAKKRKKENLKPIITTEASPQQHIAG